VPKSTDAEMEAAVASCKEAFQTWSKTTVLTRQQAMFRLQQLIKTNMVSVMTVLTILMTVIVGWLRSSVLRTSVSDRRTFSGLRSICSGCVITSAIGQPTRPTQPFILPGSINE